MKSRNRRSNKSGRRRSNKSGRRRSNTYRASIPIRIAVTEQVENLRAEYAQRIETITTELKQMKEESNRIMTQLREAEDYDSLREDTARLLQKMKEAHANLYGLTQTLKYVSDKTAGNTD